MKKLIASAALVFAIVVGQPATAGTTVVFNGNETTNWASLWETLPGSGTYTFEFTASAPVNYTLVAEYEEHWDVFVAPAPKPHNQNIEGNNDPTGRTWGGTASAFTYVFDVPDMSRYFFYAKNEYDNYGIQPGTKMYYQSQGENPFFEFQANRGDDTQFSYTMKITQFATVPEPATWAMMIIGFGAVGSMVRSSRRNAIGLS